MQVVTVNPKVQGGVPCFAGTRVPAVSLFDHLIRGYTIDEFLADFPSVQREQVAGLLDMAKHDVPAHAELVETTAILESLQNLTPKTITRIK